MGKGIPAAQTVDPQSDETVSGDRPPPRRKAAGRKPRIIEEIPAIPSSLKAVVRHCWPELNRWLNSLPDPRFQPMCRYTGAHLWWEIILMFLSRGASRHAFDVSRNLGHMPENVLELCDQDWDEDLFGVQRTVTCSDNTVHHAKRVPVSAVAQIPLAMVKRLMNMRMLDAGRLFDTWWLIAIDGTVQQRAGKKGRKRWRMALEARLIGPYGLELPLMVEFLDMRDPIRDKEDCELRGFHRLTRRMRREFPRLSICLLLDGLYAVKSVFDRCDQYDWKFIITLREGRQPNAWDEAVQTMLLSPARLWRGRRKGEYGWVEQTVRWTEQVPVQDHCLNVLFLGEIGPQAATLWAWVTNLRMDVDRVPAIINNGGRARFRQEENFNVLKNNGYGLEHTFCAHPRASKNYHLMLLVADILWQILAEGVLNRLKHLARKLTEVGFVRLLFASLLYVPITPHSSPIGQIRFAPT